MSMSRCTTALALVLCAAPSSVALIGRTDQANHQSDLADFWAALDAGNLPSVSFLKAPAYQDGHAGYSDPLDEQEFLVSTVNHLQRTQDWGDIAVVILYDDSDGWYDHVMGVNVRRGGRPVGSRGGWASLRPAACGHRAQSTPARCRSGRARKR